MKGIFWQEGESFTNSMSLIVSLLVRYPSIATISLDPALKSFQFTFVIAHLLSSSEFERFAQRVKESMETVVNLAGRAPRLLDLSLSRFEGLSFIEVKRDIDSLLPGEIALLAALIDEEFEGELVRDQEEGLEEEDQVIQEEMIEHMLEDLKDSRQEKKLIGFREEGRVMVFNRASFHK